MSMNEPKLSTIELIVQSLVASLEVYFTKHGNEVAL
jgi:hypothetical protein